MKRREWLKLYREVRLMRRDGADRFTFNMGRVLHQWQGVAMRGGARYRAIADNRLQCYRLALAGVECAQ